MAKDIRNRRTQGRQNRSSTSSSARTFLRSPFRSTAEWFDEYFLHQSKLFYSLVMLIVLMVSFGLIMVLSSSNVNSIKADGDPFGYFKGQLLYAVVGFVSMIFISMRSMEWIQRFANLLMLGGIVGQLLVLVPGIGVSVGGNTNWIRILFIQIQPSEFLKLGLILFIAGFLSQSMDQLWDFNRGAKQAIVAGFGSALLVFITGRDMGTAIVIVMIVIALMYLAGLPQEHLRKFYGLAAIGFAAGAVISPSRVLRILNFFVSMFGQSSAVDDGANWQVKHGTWALASGGIFGTGLGQSKLNWGWIPEVENDFIFAIIGEEWGLIGSIVVLGCFFLLSKHLRNIARNARTDFASLAVNGIMLWILLQALINIAVVLHLMPVLGVPLPLMSKGGSSLIAVLMSLGVVLAIERQPQSQRVSRR
ncbi:MAG: cell division protein FtsW [Micrococcales bacterium]|nr:cell division protein FtsW [Micrococcales bacterium]